MVEIIYYVAVSVDGYIATPDGGVEWLSAFETADNDYGYNDFYASVDGVLMGSRTYQKLTEFGDWVYPGKPCWVCSRRAIANLPPEVTLTPKNPGEVVAELEAAGLHRVWLVGGGQLAASFRAERLLSEYILSVIPTILGTGIPLFAPAPTPQDTLRLIEHQVFPRGLVQLRYLPL